MTAELETYEHIHGGIRFVSRLARPNGPGPHPGVMVMHDGQGVGDFLCERARQLAALGYVAIATDMYGEGRQYGAAGEGAAAVVALRKQGAMLRERIVAAYHAFARIPDVDASRVGAIGFCFGGQCVLELARSGEPVCAVASFHGTLTTHAPAQAGAVRARVLAMTGARDPFAPAADRAAFEQEMTAAGADWHMALYGLGKHGFSDPVADEAAKVMDGVGYSPFLDRFSWAEATAFLDLAVCG